MSSFVPNSMEITSSVFAERYWPSFFLCWMCILYWRCFSKLDDFVIHMMQAIMQ